VRRSSTERPPIVEQEAKSAPHPEELRRGRLRAVLAATGTAATANVLPGPRPKPVAIPPQAPDESARDYQRRIEILERRLAKLADALEARDEQLLAGQAADQEPGIASRYSEVQGLEDGAPQGEMKRDMMAQIFSANLALQEGMTSTQRVAE